MKTIVVAGPMGSGKDTVSDIVTDHAGSMRFVRVAFADAIKRLVRNIFPIPEENAWGPSALRSARLPFPLLTRQDAHFRSGLVARAVHHMIRQHRRLGEVEAAQAVFVDRAFDKKEAEGHLTPRYLYQQFGTEFGRALYEHVWVEEVFDVARQLMNPYVSYAPSARTLYDPKPRDFDYAAVVVPDGRFPSEGRRARELGGHVWWVEDAKRNDRTAPPEHSSEPRREDFDGIATATIDNNGTLDDLRREVCGALHRIF